MFRQISAQIVPKSDRYGDDEIFFAIDDETLLVLKMLMAAFSVDLLAEATYWDGCKVKPTDELIKKCEAIYHELHAMNRSLPEWDRYFEQVGRVDTPE